jgi:hypothetical protein
VPIDGKNKIVNDWFMCHLSVLIPICASVELLIRIDSICSTSLCKVMNRPSLYISLKKHIHSYKASVSCIS